MICILQLNTLDIGDGHQISVTMASFKSSSGKDNVDQTSVKVKPESSDDIWSFLPEESEGKEFPVTLIRNAFNENQDNENLDSLEVNLFLPLSKFLLQRISIMYILI